VSRRESREILAQPRGCCGRLLRAVLPGARLRAGSRFGHLEPIVQTSTSKVGSTNTGFTRARSVVHDAQAMDLNEAERQHEAILAQGDELVLQEGRVSSDCSSAPLAAHADAAMSRSRRRRPDQARPRRAARRRRRSLARHAPKSFVVAQARSQLRHARAVSAILPSDAAIERRALPGLAEVGHLAQFSGRCGHSLRYAASAPHVGKLSAGSDSPSAASFAARSRRMRSRASARDSHRGKLAGRRAPGDCAWWPVRAHSFGQSRNSRY